MTSNSCSAKVSEGYSKELDKGNIINRKKDKHSRKWNGSKLRKLKQKHNADSIEMVQIVFILNIKLQKL